MRHLKRVGRGEAHKTPGGGVVQQPPYWELALVVIAALVIRAAIDGIIQLTPDYLPSIA